MSSYNDDNNTDRGIRLSSLADLGAVIDLQTLPPGPEATDRPEPDQAATAGSTTPAPPSLAGLLAQLASLSGGPESMAREDARAREQATLGLAQYETLVAEQLAAEAAGGWRASHSLRCAESPPQPSSVGRRSSPPAA